MRFSVDFPPRVTSKLQITIFSGTQTWVNQDDVRLHAVCLEYLEGLCSWKSQHGHHLVLMVLMVINRVLMVQNVV